MRTSERDEHFALFFQAHSESLRRFGAFLTGDSEVGADLAQEAMARVYRKWGGIRSGDPNAYARRIVVNLVRGSHRRSLVARRHKQHEASIDLQPSRSGEVDDWLELSAALRQLPVARRATVVLRFYEDMSEQQIADTLDRPVGTVKSDLHRGLKKLKEILEEQPVKGTST
jgi:RNA polymerase sigma-70 factor (sigma-E family)